MAVNVPGPGAVKAVESRLLPHQPVKALSFLS